MTAISPQEEGINDRFIASYNALKALRRVGKKGDFCESLGLRREYFSRYERNELAVPDEAIKNLSNLYHISKDWLLYNKGEMFQKEEPQTGGFSNVQTAKAHNIQGNNISTGEGDCRHQLELALLKIESLEKEVKDKEKQINDKEKHIDFLQGLLQKQ